MAIQIRREMTIKNDGILGESATDMDYRCRMTGPWRPQVTVDPLPLRLYSRNTVAFVHEMRECRNQSSYSV
jgi:hypothetical protein